MLVKTAARLLWIGLVHLLERGKGRRRLGAGVVAVLLALLVLAGRNGGGHLPFVGPPAGRSPAAWGYCRPDATGLPPPGACGDVWRRAEKPNPRGLIMAPPSVSVTAIAGALRTAGSPLADTTHRRDGRTYAEYIWDQGKRLGIDPGIVMGFFNQESDYGTRGMAVLTHSLSNQRPAARQRALCGADGCYAYEDNWFAGIDDIYALLRHYARVGLDTVEQAVPVWAPSSDYNDDANFIAGVHNTMAQLNAPGHAP